jgi:hypothetical protein
MFSNIHADIKRLIILYLPFYDIIKITNINKITNEQIRNNYNTIKYLGSKYLSIHENRFLKDPPNFKSVFKLIYKPQKIEDITLNGHELKLRRVLDELLEKIGYIRGKSSSNILTKYGDLKFKLLKIAREHNYKDIEEYLLTNCDLIGFIIIGNFDDGTPIKICI